MKKFYVELYVKQVVEVDSIDELVGMDFVHANIHTRKTLDDHEYFDRHKVFRKRQIVEGFDFNAEYQRT